MCNRIRKCLEFHKSLKFTCFSPHREKPIEGFLDDYSFLIKGLIDFYVATLDVDALKWAKELQDTQVTIWRKCSRQLLI